MANNVNVKKLEADLWESADLLRAGSKLTSNQYCMPVLGLIFLRYAYSRFKLVEQEILKDRPMRGGRVLPVEQSDFAEKSALFLPKEAQYNYLVNLPANIPEQGLTGIEGNPLNSLGEVVNNAMELVEQQSEQLQGVLPKDYTIFSDELLGELLRIFNNDALDDVGGDVIGRIYEYFLNKFAKNVAQDDGVFFTPKSLVKMIVNVLEPAHGVLLDPACGSGGMFVQTGDFVNHAGMIANNTMTFYGQEKVEYNAKLCLMNMAVHGLTGVIKSGDEANTFYHDAHNLNGCCDYVMANPPFNVDKVKSESAQSAGRLPFGLPGVNKAKEIGIKLFCKFIAAVIVEVSRVHIKDQLTVFDGIRFQTSCGDYTVLFHLLKHFYIIVRGCFEMNVQRSAFRYDVLIAVAVLFTLIVFLYLCHISRCFQVLIPGYGAVDSIISCHWIFPFFEICRQRRAGERHFFKV